MPPWTSNLEGIGFSLLLLCPQVCEFREEGLREKGSGLFALLVPLSFLDCAHFFWFRQL